MEQPSQFMENWCYDKVRGRGVGRTGESGLLLHGRARGFARPRPPSRDGARGVGA